MRSLSNHTLFHAAALSLMIGVAGCNCGSEQGDHTTGSATDRMADSLSTANGNGANGGMNGTGTNDASGMNGTNGTTSGATTTAGMERMQATTNLGGLRATLMAELELVRTRLNDGTRDKAVTAKDKERAAELAQGLERLDRALAAVNASNDTTWTAIRTSSMQEVDDIKAWMAGRGMKVQS